MQSTKAGSGSQFDPNRSIKSWRESSEGKQHLKDFVARHDLIARIISACPFTEGVVAFDTMRNCVMLMRPLSAAGWEEAGPLPRPFDWGTDERRLRTVLQYLTEKPISREMMHDAICQSADEHKFDSLSDELNKFGDAWDGKPRLDAWLHEYLGAKDTTYTRAVGKKFLIGAVARALEPACKMDNMLVLVSPAQGLSKSSVAALLGGAFFGDNLPSVRDAADRNLSMYLRRHWVIEDPELASLRKASNEDAKAFLSRQRDEPRMMGKEEYRDYPRRCVFIGTTNKTDHLKDSTGNRRYWPVRVEACGAVALDLLKRDRAQLLGEAVHAYRSVDPAKRTREHFLWWLTLEEEELARAEQDAAYERDEWEDTISEYLAKNTSKALRREKDIKVMSIAADALGLDPVHVTKAVQNRIRAVLVRLGWEAAKSGSERYWRPKAALSLVPQVPHEPYDASLQQVTENAHLSRDGLSIGT